MKIKPLNLLIALVLSIQFLPGASASEYFARPLQGPGAAGIEILDSLYANGQNISKLIIRDDSLTDTAQNIENCTQMGIYPCDLKLPDAFYGINLVLPPCSELILEWCIDGLSIYSKNNQSASSQANLIRSINNDVINAYPAKGLPQGGSVSLWRTLDQLNSGNVNTYAVYAQVAGSADHSSNFAFGELKMVVIPYAEKLGVEYAAPKHTSYIDTNGKRAQSISITGENCAWVEKGVCGEVRNFPKDTRARLSVRVGNTLSGWLMGRMSDPEVSVKQIGAKQNLLTVDSEPVLVPKFYVNVPKERITETITATDLMVKAGKTAIIMHAANQVDFELLDAWDALTNQRSEGIYSTWAVSAGQRGRDSACFNDKTTIFGFVSTNAAAYDGYAPKFENGTLKYRVWSQHLNPDGTVFQGKYDLLIRSETARCLYGFSKAPLSATVSVTSQDGTNQIATTIVKEDKGWIHLGAYGFTFSSPSINVKLNQASSLRAKTITCMKGKVTKKISSLAPKCPKGFKLKN